MFRKFRTGGQDVIYHRRNTDRANLRQESENPRASTNESPSLPSRSISEPSAILSSTDPQSRRHSAATDDTVVEPVVPTLSHRRQRSRSKDTEDDPLGLSLIYSAPNSDVDVIFVHGLGGSSYRTWSWERNTDNFWPAWLRHEQGLSHFRVFSFGYNAKFSDSDNPLSILDFSKALLVRMRTFRQGDESLSIGLKPIIFIAHSMGGLVVKKALIIGKNDDYYSVMLSKVHGIMFLSTPHRGSSYAHSLNTLLSVMIGTSSKVYVSELESSSTSIEDIGEQFRAICSSWELVSLYESLPTKFSLGIKRMIVGKDSGVLNYPREISSPVDADHHTVCKYHSRLDPNYLLVTDLLRQMTHGLISEEAPPVHQDSAEHGSRDLLENVLGIRGVIREDLDKNLFRSLPGSCQWLHHRDSFTSWLDATDDNHRILCLTGLPGTGKSTLAAKTVDYIQKALTDKSCQYHFFVDSQPMKRASAHCLRAIAFQLAICYPTFADRIFQLHHDSGFTASSQKFQVIWETIFENIVFKFDFGCTLHWVIDAVDECDTPGLLVTHLTQMKPRGSIKVLFLTRPKKDITSLITARLSASRIESVSIENTIDDIRHYVHSMVREILPDDGPTRENVIEQIITKAQGSFLWTKLALESLRNNWHTAEDIKLALNKVPDDMQSLYHSMIDNVKNQPPRLRGIAFRVLAWVSCAFRPLSIAELAAALKPEYDGFVSLSDTIVQVCGHFVRVDDNTISLIHSTARQFLLSSSSLIEEHLGTGTCHDHLAVACLQYLCQDHWRQTLSGIYEDDVSSDRLQSIYTIYPLLQYSMNYWAFHVSNATLDASSVLMFLRLFCNKFLLQWIHAVSLCNALHIIPRAAHYVKTWIRRSRNNNVTDVFLTNPGLSERLFLEEWVTDLIRIIGKFGPNLLHKPSTIYRHIPPLCPETSIISRTYNQGANSLLSVKGLSVEGWDDRLSRLPLGPDELASIIKCAGVYFLTLISHSGTVIVWHMETCSEVRRLEHQEWVTLLETNKTGSLAATAGRFTFRVWDLSTGHQLYSFAKNNPARAMCLAFLNSDAELAVGYDDCSVFSIDLLGSKERLLFVEENPDPHRSCTRFMSLSPDQTKVAVGFRGRPVVIWNMSLSNKSEPRRCIRMADKDLLEGGEDVFNSPEIIRWHPNGSSLLILYQDATIVMWDLVEDEQFEFGDTEAREMVLNNDGTLLLTSSNGGSISVWALPKLILIYHLHSDGFVKDLTFSPDGQQIYDVRGSGCSVWAPDVLVRDDGDREETSSSFDGSSVSEALSDPVYAQDHSSQGRITALVADDEDEYFCCGRDDGSVSIHNVIDGKRVRKVSNHSTTVDIICIGWSLSRRYLASADDSGKIILKRLRIKEDGKWAVFPMFELRVDDAVVQLLFNPGETLVLISTNSSDRIWDIKSKKEVYKKIWKSAPGRKWLNHPENPTWLIQLWPNQQVIFEWANPGRIAQHASHSGSGGDKPDVSDAVPSIVLTGPTDDQETVATVVYPSSHHYLVVESLPRKHSSKSRSARGARWDLISLKNLTPASDGSPKRKTLLHLAPEIQHLLSCYHDRLVFLDHMNWLCTCIIGWETGPIKRHFFLPRDWINASTVSLLAFNKKGTLLCAREGDVAIVRYTRGF
ncbi:hypothetical protein F5Y14DRAFT_428823 [Nemania sp. NC0429]|nr:hypothetical protein F5Y14DRAFT_428823 [Nemania sp. NC0429]